MTLLDENYIQDLKNKFLELEEAKDRIIQRSIKITRLSKTIIYSLIRGDEETANKAREEIKKLVQENLEDREQYPMFYGNISTSLQEYAEAEIFYYYLKENRIPSHKELGIDEVNYTLGLMDFCGELLRKAVEEMIKGNIEFAKQVKNTIEEIYLKMLTMDFKNYDYRRKVDYVSNILNRLTEYILLKSKK